MVKVEYGTIFESNAQTLVNTINCVGVMGKGLALEFKNRYPAMFNKYKEFCDKDVFKPGVLWIYKAPDGKWILNFPTKIDWKNPSKIEYIEEGLKKFVEIWKNKMITSIAFPLLGCHNGGLNPDEVIPLMKKYLEKCDGLDVTIYDDRDPIEKVEVNNEIAESLEEFKKEGSPKEVIDNAKPLVDEEPPKSEVTIEESAIEQNIEEVKEDNEKKEEVDDTPYYKPEEVNEKITVSGEIKPAGEVKHPNFKYSEEQEILNEIIAERRAINEEVDKVLNEFAGAENTPEVRKAVTKKLYNVINYRGFPAGSVFQI